MGLGINPIFKFLINVILNIWMADMIGCWHKMNLKLNSGGCLRNNTFLFLYWLYRTDAASIRVVASEYSLRRKSGLEQNRSVKKITMHPDYDDNTLENDIAILEVGLVFPPVQSSCSNKVCFRQLDSPLDFSTKRVGSISLGRDAVNAGTNVTVTGWGTLQEGGRRIPSLPRKVTVPVISNEDCSKSYAPLEYGITDTMLCAGFSEGTNALHQNF